MNTSEKKQVLKLQETTLAQAELIHKLVNALEIALALGDFHKERDWHKYARDLIMEGRILEVQNDKKAT